MSNIHAIILGALQGLTELFPVSSLGHSVLLPEVFGWHINESDNSFLIFLVATHLATSLVLFGFYWREWVAIIKGIFRSLRERTIGKDDVDARLGWLLVVGTIPAGILGLLFEDKLKELFASPIYVSLFLALNGLLLLGIEWFRTRYSTKTATEPTWSQSVWIGCAQCLALLPGFSRTGSTLGGGLLAGLDHEHAARFSFLLATPIIFAAAVLKLPELLTGGAVGQFATILYGALAAAIAAYIAVRFLENYFKTKTLTPFGIYCLLVGSVLFVYFLR